MQWSPEIENRLGVLETAGCGVGSTAQALIASGTIRRKASEVIKTGTFIKPRDKIKGVFE